MTLYEYLKYVLIMIKLFTLIKDFRVILKNDWNITHIDLEKSRHAQSLSQTLR